MIRCIGTCSLVIAAILLCRSDAAGADDFEIFTCRDAQGNITMQNDPCPEVPQRAKAAPPQPARQPARPAAAPTRAKPPPQPRPAPRRAATVPAPSRSTSWIRLPAAPTATRSHRLGQQSFPTRLDGAVPSPDYATPETTWRTFLAAIEAGDAARALACLTPDARRELGSDAESFPLEEIRAMIASLVRIEDEGSLGPFWSIYGAREGGQPKWIFFERIEAGWKIAGI